MADDFKQDPDIADFETPTNYAYEEEDVPVFKMPGIDDVEENDVDIYYQYVGAHVEL
jgi:hypothetical protein